MLCSHNISFPQTEETCIMLQTLIDTGLVKLITGNCSHILWCQKEYFLKLNKSLMFINAHMWQ